MKMALKISVMLSTLNRVGDLLKTLKFLRSLNPQPFEVMVTADGCMDETPQRVVTEFPEVRLFINKTGQGSVASRHRMMSEASGDLVLALDDDSYPEQLDCIKNLSVVFMFVRRLSIV